MLNFGVFFEVCVIITSIAADYKYPMRKTLSNYTFTIYNNSKVSTSDFIAVRTLSSYHHCVDACISTISGCQSISLENSENNTVICKFYRSDSPSTVKSAEHLFITKKQLYCSQSCEIQNKNPCGNCKCHPSCNSRNARQYLCNCTQATEARRSCQEHYNAGFTKTALFLINPDNETSFKVLCEMEKLDKKNPVIQYDVCTFQSNREFTGYTYQSAYVMSHSKCIEKCIEHKASYPYEYSASMNMISYDSNNCQCLYGGSVSLDDIYGSYLTYCYISNNQCVFQSYNGHYSYTYAYRIKLNDICLKYCQDYIAQQGSIESGGYLLQGVSSSNYGYYCQCVFGKKTFYASNYYDGCYFEFKMPTPSLSNRQVWIPMMTRFASWEGNFWDKTYEEYEDGFGVANQQWLGLKNIQRITNVFKTDMRVDYTFQEDFTFSTLYYNMRVDTKEKGYMLTYERYDSNGSNEPDRFLQGGSPTFQACKKWWATCDYNKYAPTSPYKIQFGLARDLVRIQFLLRTKEDAQ